MDEKWSPEKRLEYIAELVLQREAGKETLTQILQRILFLAIAHEGFLEVNMGNYPEVTKLMPKGGE